MDGNAQEFSTRAEELVDKYAKLVYQLAYARTRSREAAEDIFQDVFLKLVHKRPVFDSEEHEKAWFCRVTVNCANSYWRNPFRRRTQSLDGTEAGVLAAPGPEEGIGELNACLDRLSPELRTIVHLYYYEGYSGPEIAARLSKGESAVRMALMRAVLSGEQKPRRHLTRRGLTVLAAAAVLTVTALAAGPTIWQAIRNDLGNRAPYAAEVESVCEDQGIRLEGVTALADNRVLRVYFTARDLEGGRLSEDTYLDYSLENGQNTTWVWGSTAVEQLSYDPETQTALFVVTVTGTESLPRDCTLRLEVGRVLNGGRCASSMLTSGKASTRSFAADGTPVQEEPGYQWHGRNGASGSSGLSWPTGEILPSIRTDDGTTVLLPQPEREAAMDARDPFPIVAAGIAADGRLHVRVRNQAGTVWSDLSIQARFPRGEDPTPGEQFTAVAVGEDIDFCFQLCGPEELARLEDIRVFGSYSALSAPVDGSWSLEFPIHSVAARTIPVSLTLPAAPEGMTVEGEALELSPLSLTLLCDEESIYYDTPQVSGNVKGIRFERFAPTVTLQDGTQLTAGLTSYDTWWATWTFDQPIDPDQVVSITINGQTIPLGQS
ncbi:RNA polymerase sigma factor [Intestinimonas massiliensis (ex Afouda et al. 2020)]|uniref:RNA polymerase sigma factor n=1 Tax=Intestinimonas massiliensis (ex Afouda et al. 2020) TaxID=1673721 RepID=UPI001030DAA5|nr:sigma-70 family RNA polymerase sigma factor [Intestinimonas massiliensis (ex Afouda et al. 2020)]